MAPLGPLAGITLPPLVLVPSRQARRSRQTVSVFEHEIVHVNQVLTDAYPPDVRPASVDELVSHFYARAMAEFEANFLQAFRWPQPAVKRYGYSLMQWGLLRGHTQSLEEVLRDLAFERLDEALAEGFLVEVPRQARWRLGELRLPDEVLAWFETRWARDVVLALTVLRDEGVDVNAVRLRPVLRWLKGRPEFEMSAKSAPTSTGAK